MITENLKHTKENMKEACRKSGTNSENVTLIAVSKTKPVSMIQEALAEGVLDFGEKKVQELVDKYEQLPKNIRWHLIGHLQRNKVKYIIDKVSLIHSIDSYSLIKEVEKQAKKHDLKMPILIQVNVAKEESKHGFAVEEIEDVFDYLKECPHLIVKGLMMMAPHIDSNDTAVYFKQTKELFDQLNCKYSEFEMTELSMGMSNDYHEALKYGATMIRVGSALFE